MSRHERRSSLRYIALLLAVIICFCAAPSAEANAAAAAAVQTHASAAAQGRAAAVAAAAVPGRVALSSISSANYREITLSWKEAAGANYYFVYYKAVGAAEWPSGLQKWNGNSELETANPMNMSGNAHIWNSIGMVVFAISMRFQLFAPLSK